MAQSLQDTPAGQIRIETGLGRIKALDHTPPQRNAKVTIDAEHLSLDLTGWVDTHGPLWHDVAEAARLGVRIGYRIEVHRKAGIDAALPLDEVPNTSKVRDLVDLAAVDGNGNPFDPARTNPALGGAPAGPALDAGAASPAALPAGTVIDVDEVADVEGPQPSMREAGLQATAQRLAQRAREAGAAEGDTAGGPRCASCNLPLAGSRARRDPVGIVHDPTCPGEPFEDAPAELTAAAAAEAEAAAAELAGEPEILTDGRVYTCKVAGCDWPPAGEDPTRGDLLAHLDEHAEAAKAAARPPEGRPVADGRRGPRVAEAKPWEPYNGDGSLNLGSYAITASASAVHLAHDLLLAKAKVDAAELGHADQVTPAKVRALAALLLDAADAVQARHRGDGRVDRMDNSHTRARGMVRVALDAYPVPWGVDADARRRWVEDLGTYAGDLLEVALQLRDPREA